VQVQGVSSHVTYGAIVVQSNLLIGRNIAPNESAIDAASQRIPSPHA
jgi:hypothetical protein